MPECMRVFHFASENDVSVANAKHLGTHWNNDLLIVVILITNFKDCDCFFFAHYSGFLLLCLFSNVPKGEFYMQLDLFEHAKLNESEMMMQIFELKESQAKLRRGIFQRVDELKKTVIDLQMKLDEMGKKAG